jgi:pimeloyl-ACP methyl ester carboxylesterase
MVCRLLAVLFIVMPVAILTSNVMAQQATPQTAQIVDQRYEVDPGRSLYLRCTGTGSPTVIFETGWGGDSSVWFEVAPSIAQTTRTCTYDRAGLGRSDPAPDGPRTIQDSVNDLHVLLAVAEIPGPYVLVGASLGGLIARLYASQFPDDMAGLVLVDGLAPGFLAAALMRLPADIAVDAAEQATGADPQDPEHIDLLASDDLAAAAALPPVVPTIVLANDTLQRDLPSDLDWQTLTIIEVTWRAYELKQAEELQGRLVIAKGSGHNIQEEQPAIVIDAVTEVVNAVRDPSSWATPIP